MTLESDVIGGLSFLLCFITVFAPLVAEKHSSKMKGIAASIQQYIDISLYSDNSYKGMNQNWHCPLEQHQIIELVSKFPDKGFTSKEKWYEDYSTKQYWEQIYLCQKENIRWDGNLRKQYRIFCNSIIAIIAFTIIALSFAFNPTFLDALRFAPWALPFIGYMVSFNKHMKEDEERIAQIRNKAKFVLASEQNLDIEKVLNQESELQDMIFEHRKQALLIPNVFYILCRSRQQQNEESIARNEKKGGA